MVKNGRKDFGGHALKFYEAEITFINSRIGLFLDKRASEKENSQLAREESGQHLNATMILKMRAMEAVFFDGVAAN